MTCCVLLHRAPYSLCAARVCFILCRAWATIAVLVLMPCIGAMKDPMPGPPQTSPSDSLNTSSGTSAAQPAGTSNIPICPRRRNLLSIAPDGWRRSDETELGLTVLTDLPGRVAGDHGAGDVEGSTPERLSSYRAAATDAPLWLQADGVLLVNDLEGSLSVRGGVKNALTCAMSRSDTDPSVMSGILRIWLKIRVRLPPDHPSAVSTIAVHFSVVRNSVAGRKLNFDMSSDTVLDVCFIPLLSVKDVDTLSFTTRLIFAGSDENDDKATLPKGAEILIGIYLEDAVHGDENEGLASSREIFEAALGSVDPTLSTRVFDGGLIPKRNTSWSPFSTPPTQSALEELRQVFLHPSTCTAVDASDQGEHTSSSSSSWLGLVSGGLSKVGQAVSSYVWRSYLLSGIMNGWFMESNAFDIRPLRCQAQNEFYTVFASRKANVAEISLALGPPTLEVMKHESMQTAIQAGHALLLFHALVYARIPHSAESTLDHSFQLVLHFVDTNSDTLYDCTHMVQKQTKPSINHPGITGEINPDTLLQTPLDEFSYFSISEVIRIPKETARILAYFFFNVNQTASNPTQSSPIHIRNMYAVVAPLNSLEGDSLMKTLNVTPRGARMVSITLSDDITTPQELGDSTAESLESAVTENESITHDVTTLHDIMPQPLANDVEHTVTDDNDAAIFDDIPVAVELYDPHWGGTTHLQDPALQPPQPSPIPTTTATDRLNQFTAALELAAKIYSEYHAEEPGSDEDPSLGSAPDVDPVIPMDTGSIVALVAWCLVICVTLVYIVHGTLQTHWSGRERSRKLTSARYSLDPIL